jgi:hypothetical protein
MQHQPSTDIIDSNKNNNHSLLYWGLLGLLGNKTNENNKQDGVDGGGCDGTAMKNNNNFNMQDQPSTNIIDNNKNNKR